MTVSICAWSGYSLEDSCVNCLLYHREVGGKYGEGRDLYHHLSSSLYDRVSFMLKAQMLYELAEQVNYTPLCAYFSLQIYLLKQGRYELLF